MPKNQFFRNVELGKHEEIIRNMLYTGDPGREDKYPCMLVGILVGGKFHADWMLPPERKRVDGRYIYRVVISGILYVFYISSTDFPLPPGEIYLSTSGRMTIFCRDIGEIPFISDLLPDFKEALKGT